MPNQTSATLRDLPPLTVIDLGGEVTTFAEDAVNGAFKQASEQGAKNILLNFKDVEYINSAGISVIIGLLTEARKSDQTLMITGLTPHYTKIFQMMGLAQYAPLYETEEAARQAVSA
jgi:anti-anti-sigma factor